MGFDRISRISFRTREICRLREAGIMNGFIIGLYGVYLLLVGFEGNSSKMVDALRKDAPGFLPWAVSIAVLAAMYENENTRQIAKPFIFLLIITFVLRNFDVLKKQSKELYKMSGVKLGA
jgi:hypothetical protein